jgi:hypothetical protein
MLIFAVNLENELPIVDPIVGKDLFMDVLKPSPHAILLGHPVFAASWVTISPSRKSMEAVASPLRALP